MLGAYIHFEGGLHESGGLTTSVLFNNWDISNIGGAGAVTFEHIVSPTLVVCRHFLSTIQHKVRIMSPKKYNDTDNLK